MGPMPRQLHFPDDAQQSEVGFHAILYTHRATGIPFPLIQIPHCPLFLLPRPCMSAAPDHLAVHARTPTHPWAGAEPSPPGPLPPLALPLPHRGGARAAV
jgi:hypothetical protein